MKLDSTARRVLIATGLALAATMAFADTNPGAATVRPPGYKPLKGNPEAGKALFNDTKLSTNGMSCASCHANHGAFSTSFAKPYPHTVAMARDQLGRKSVYLDEMVQACMVMPMATKPLPWNSKELADLTAYVAELQKTFKPAR
ncbi:cytochrome c peroxidase [Chitinivorax sp. PXF-14]|uniref:c-type cytochrome n=1 Tax=Chitinivorax sp. PXF-14 TaxID=3230488 RepID=UPI003467EB29